MSKAAGGDGIDPDWRNDLNENTKLLKMCETFYKDLMANQEKNPNKDDQHVALVKVYINSIVVEASQLLSTGHNNFLEKKLLELLKILQDKKAVLLNEEVQKLLLKILETSSMDKVEIVNFARTNKLNSFLAKFAEKFLPELSSNVELIPKLPFRQVENIFLSQGSSIERLKALTTWMDKNSGKQLWDLRYSIDAVIKTFDTSEFTKDDIVGEVHRSGFYSSEDLLKMLSKIIDGIQGVEPKKKKGREAKIKGNNKWYHHTRWNMVSPPKTGKCCCNNWNKVKA